VHAEYSVVPLRLRLLSLSSSQSNDEPTHHVHYKDSTVDPDQCAWDDGEQSRYVLSVSMSLVRTSTRVIVWAGGLKLARAAAIEDDPLTTGTFVETRTLRNPHPGATVQSVGGVGSDGMTTFVLANADAGLTGEDHFESLSFRSNFTAQKFASYLNIDIIHRYTQLRS
jgi:hypothetical protein